MNPSLDRFSQPIETRWQSDPDDEDVELEKADREYQQEKDNQDENE